MNGPSFPQGDQMAKVETAPKWSSEEAVIAETFLTTLGTFDKKNGFQRNKHLAADALGYKSYDEMPDGVKSFVSSKAAMVKKERKHELENARVEYHVQEAKKEWEDPEFAQKMTYVDND